MTPTAVSTWFYDIEPVSLDEDRFVLCRPPTSSGEIIRSRYLPTLERAFYESSSPSRSAWRSSAPPNGTVFLPRQPGRCRAGAQPVHL